MNGARSQSKVPHWLIFTFTFAMARRQFRTSHPFMFEFKVMYIALSQKTNRRMIFERKIEKWMALIFVRRENRSKKMYGELNQMNVMSELQSSTNRAKRQQKEKWCLLPQPKHFWILKIQSRGITCELMPIFWKLVPQGDSPYQKKKIHPGLVRSGAVRFFRH